MREREGKEGGAMVFSSRDVERRDSPLPEDETHRLSVSVSGRGLLLR